jgi:hypothetical protein
VEKLEKGREGGGIKEDLSIVVRGSDSRGLNRSGLAPAFGGVPLYGFLKSWHQPTITPEAQPSGLITNRH